MFSARFFFNDSATTEIYTLSLHDALPIWRPRSSRISSTRPASKDNPALRAGSSIALRSSSRFMSGSGIRQSRSEEHTSELQSQSNLVCRLLLEKKKKIKSNEEECKNEYTT